MNIEIKTAGSKILPRFNLGYAIIYTKVGNETIEVPFLITKQRIVQPIIGFNVISSLVRTNGPTNKTLISNLNDFSPTKVCVNSVITVQRMDSVGFLSYLNFDFTIKYRPGVINRDADCLSRLPVDISK